MFVDIFCFFFGFGGVGGLSFLGVAPCDRDVWGHRKSMGEKFTSEKGTPKKKYAKKLLKNYVNIPKSGMFLEEFWFPY